MKTLLIIALLGVVLGCGVDHMPSNDCVAKANPACICPQVYDPVCGCDGKTYGNTCEAACAGVRVVARGTCPGQ